MCVIVDYENYIEDGCTWNPNKMMGKGSYNCSETGYHKFEPYNKGLDIEILIDRLDEIIKLIKEWNNG